MAGVYILLLVDIILSASAQLLLKKGMSLLGAFDFSLKAIPFLIFSVLKNWYIIVALIFYGFAMVLWLFVLSKISLSLAYPFTALMYVFIIFGSWLFFREQVGVYHIIGIILILAGLFFLFHSK